jgi:hypothetical protein
LNLPLPLARNKKTGCANWKRKSDAFPLSFKPVDRQLGQMDVILIVIFIDCGPMGFIFDIDY